MRHRKPRDFAALSLLLFNMAHDTAAECALFVTRIAGLPERYEARMALVHVARIALQ